VQGLLAEHSIKLFLPIFPPHLQAGLKDLWANSGDAISRIYAGTGALKSGFTRSGKRTLAGILDDSVKSVNRFVINNFQVTTCNLHRKLDIDWRI
jgi:adenine-specific DNA methylase